MQHLHRFLWEQSNMVRALTLKNSNKAFLVKSTNEFEKVQFEIFIDQKVSLKLLVEVNVILSIKPTQIKYQTKDFDSRVWNFLNLSTKKNCHKNSCQSFRSFQDGLETRQMHKFLLVCDFSWSLKDFSRKLPTKFDEKNRKKKKKVSERERKSMSVCVFQCNLIEWM